MGASVRALLDSLRPAADEGQRREWAAACADALGLGGIAVSMGRELVWYSDPVSARVEDLQFVLGQGPSLFLAEDDKVLQLPDLARLPAERWPQFAAEAEELGVAALFVWPVHIGAVRAGTMTGYRRTAGPLSSRQTSEGWLVADALAEQVLQRWPSGTADYDDPNHSGTVDLHRAEVHQATGVLSARHGIPLAEALDRLRSQAYTSGRSLTETARSIVERELPR
ncbi:ANTAR domain-containing protein [Streptomyces apricus]|uniref:ANTAR domain-containing protein n=1 Tax=Streptomyces apricus TaxID=1828112 RepID=A0A5B0A6Z5_9ACTN|nr:ANTAR domain-containing protein [Streptomyces apricus]KAA0925424.1 ANTAR domain-containing protein [Streptomyces apricus]